MQHADWGVLQHPQVGHCLQLGNVLWQGHTRAPAEGLHSMQECPAQLGPSNKKMAGQDAGLMDGPMYGS